MKAWKIKLWARRHAGNTKGVQRGYAYAGRLGRRCGYEDVFYNLWSFIPKSVRRYFMSAPPAFFHHHSLSSPSLSLRSIKCYKAVVFSRCPVKSHITILPHVQVKRLHEKELNLHMWFQISWVVLWICRWITNFSLGQFWEIVSRFILRLSILRRRSPSLSTPGRWPHAPLQLWRFRVFLSHIESTCYPDQFIRGAGIWLFTLVIRNNYFKNSPFPYLFTHRKRLITMPPFPCPKCHIVHWKEKFSDRCHYMHLKIKTSNYQLVERDRIT